MKNIKKSNYIHNVTLMINVQHGIKNKICVKKKKKMNN